MHKICPQIYYSDIVMQIRLMQAADLHQLSEYWYDIVALRQQMEPHLRLQPNARAVWTAAQTDQLSAANTIAYTALRHNVLLGGVILTVEPNEPGHAPATIGVLRNLIVDLHTPHRRQQIVTPLLDATQADLRAREVTAYRVAVSVGLAVEQAFWRGYGARKSADLFWMHL